MTDREVTAAERREMRVRSYRSADLLEEVEFGGLPRGVAKLTLIKVRR